MSSNSAGDSPPRGDKLFTPEELAMFEKRRKESNPKDLIPLLCPHRSCKRHVSIYKFGAHFLAEHLDVKQDMALLETRRSSTVDVKILKCGLKTCLLFLNMKIPIDMNVMAGNISNSDKADQDNPGTSESLPPIVIVVLASRIAITEDWNPPDHPGDAESILTTEDKIVVWLASNFHTRLSFTAAASTYNGNLKIKYYGPVPHLDLDPIQIYEEGRGLIINCYQIAAMSENGTKPIKLDVIVHGEDTDDQSTSPVCHN